MVSILKNLVQWECATINFTLLSFFFNGADFPILTFQSSNLLVRTPSRNQIFFTFLIFYFFELAEFTGSGLDPQKFSAVGMRHNQFYLTFIFFQWRRFSNFDLSKFKLACSSPTEGSKRQNLCDHSAKPQSCWRWPDTTKVSKVREINLPFRRKVAKKPSFENDQLKFGHSCVGRELPGGPECPSVHRAGGIFTNFDLRLFQFFQKLKKQNSEKKKNLAAKNFRTPKFFLRTPSDVRYLTSVRISDSYRLYWSRYSQNKKRARSEKLES